jgi:hypothetical protein
MLLVGQDPFVVKRQCMYVLCPLDRSMGRMDHRKSEERSSCGGGGCDCFEDGWECHYSCV